MSKFNDQYYIVFKTFNENTLYLTALQKSADRNYGHTKLTWGGAPLFFENAYKEKDKKQGIIRPIGDVHMNMAYLIVCGAIRDKIKSFSIDYFQLYPSVIIDDDGEYHEDFWFFNIYEKLDCLDYDKCIIDEYEPGARSHDVEKYYLSDTILDAIPEEKRLIFRPKNTDMGYTFVHQKIADIFQTRGVDTLNLVKVSEWEAGKEFR